MTRKKALLNKTQRTQLGEFKKRNALNLGGVRDTVLEQVWRDGFICGAIHGYDACTPLNAKKAVNKKRPAKKKYLTPPVL